MKCPVCEKKMDSMVCGCGYDASRDYEQYPAFGCIPEGMASVAGLRSRMKKQIRKEKPIASNCPVCEKKMDSMVCDCGYDGSMDYGKHITFGPAAKGTVSVSGLRLRAKSLIRCADCGYHGFSLDRQKGELCCLQCGRALTAQELKPLMDVLGMKKAEQNSIVKAESKPESKPVVKAELKAEPKPVAKVEPKAEKKLEPEKPVEQEIPADPHRIVALAAGNSHVVILRADGSVEALGDNEKGQSDVNQWEGITAVAAGAFHTVGLKKDGTVVAVGDQTYGRCSVSDWKNIAAIGAGLRHTVGLKKDGTVVAVGDNSFGQCRVSGWRNVQAIAVCDKQTIALKQGGTVVAAGFSKDGRCDVTGWTKIAAIVTGANTTVGLRTDGTLVSAGTEKLGNVRDLTAIAANEHILGLRKDGTVAVLAGSGDKCNVGDWKDITAIAAGKECTVGLKKDGELIFLDSNRIPVVPKQNSETGIRAPVITAIAAGAQSIACVRTDGTVRVTGYLTRKPAFIMRGWKDPIQQIILEHRDIMAVTLGSVYGSCGMAVLKKDGTVAAAGKIGKVNSLELWPEPAKWRDIVAISMGRNHFVGLKKDGTVVVADTRNEHQHNVSSWKNIIAVSAGENYTVGLKQDGTVVLEGEGAFDQSHVSSWRNIIAVAAGSEHIIGLKKDGRVVAMGMTAEERHRLSEWREIVAIAAGERHAVGLKRDGTVVSVGHYAIGTCKMGNWKDIVAIAADEYHTVGLKKDGRLVVDGWDFHGMGDVSKLMTE